MRTVTCGACGATYPEDGWRALALAQRLEPLQVRRNILDWPDDQCIEVRACRACSANIAAKQRRPA